jgi:hypothetical protein
MAMGGTGSGYFGFCLYFIEILILKIRYKAGLLYLHGSCLCFSKRSNHLPTNTPKNNDYILL